MFTRKLDGFSNDYFTTVFIPLELSLLSLVITSFYQKGGNQCEYALYFFNFLKVSFVTNLYELYRFFYEYLTFLCWYVYFRRIVLTIDKEMKVMEVFLNSLVILLDIIVLPYRNIFRWEMTSKPERERENLSLELSKQNFILDKSLSLIYDLFIV